MTLFPFPFSRSATAPADASRGSGCTIPTARALFLLILSPFLAAAAPTMRVQPATLTFQTAVAESQPITITSDNESIPYTLETSDPWIDVSPRTGATPATVRLTVNPAGLPPGTRSGRLVILAPLAENPRLEVAVTLSVPAGLSLIPPTLTFTTTGQASQSVSLAHAGPALDFTAASGAAWLSVNPRTGVTPDTLSVAVNAAGLAPGQYSSAVTVTSAGAANSPRTLPVTLTVPGQQLPSLTLSTSTLTFTASGSQSVTLGSSGAALSYTASARTDGGGAWLSVTPSSGTTPASLTVTASTAGLAPGEYTGTVTVTATGAANSPRTIAVSLTVSAAPSLILDTDALQFVFQTGGRRPEPQRVIVRSADGQPVSYRAVARATDPPAAQWLSVQPFAGSTPAELDVAANPAGLDPGGYSGVVNITAGSAAATVNVTLRIERLLPPRLVPETPRLTFAFPQQAKADQQLLILTNPSDSLLNFTVTVQGERGSWLRVPVQRGGVDRQEPATIPVVADPKDAAPGTYTGTVLVEADNGDKVEIPVVMVVSANRQRLEVSSPSLRPCPRINSHSWSDARCSSRGRACRV